MKIFGMEGNTAGTIVKIAMGVVSASVLAGLFNMNIPEFMTTKLGGMITPLHIAAIITGVGIWLVHKKYI